MDTAQRFGLSALIVGVSIICAFLFDRLIFGHLPGIGFTLFIGALVVGYGVLAVYRRKRIPFDALWLILMLLFFASMVAVRDNELLTVLNIGACAALMLLIAEVSVRGSVRQFIHLDYLKLIVPFKFVDPLFRSIADVVSVRRYVHGNRHTVQIIRGVVITVPVLFVLGLLFASADPVFESIFSGLVDFDIEPISLVRTLIACGVAVVLIGAYAYTSTGTSETTTLSYRRLFGRIEASILLGAVNVLFLTFLAIQFTYFFGGESNIIVQGLTYAEYARRGFFELIAIAAISYLILLAAETFVERDAERHSALFKLLAGALIVQVAVIMVSSFMRLALYEEAFGFTTLRLYSHSFIIFLGVIYAFLFYKITVEHCDNAFAFRCFFAIAAFVAGMNVLNPDAFIAARNLERYGATGKIDIPYFEVLSADATVQKLEALHRVQDSEDRGRLGSHLYQRASVTREWQSWNYGRNQEHLLLMENAAMLGQFKDWEPAILEALRSMTGATSTPQSTRLE